MIDFAVTVLGGPWGPLAWTATVVAALKVGTDIYNTATGGQND